MASRMIEGLPRREREIFEIVASAGRASAVEVRVAMDDPPSHSAVRTLLARLEKRGLLRHRLVDQRYVYESVPQPAKVRESALQQLVKTFFNGSAASAATALLGLSRNLDPAELDRLQRAIDEARERGS
ncbi:MAG TPA: BlaI/MecI/CopY family transcriptional regulator [Allosphingosinicella sp.]|nr:BlaI/MecI/CopY family transcriptional regulator [Allosphingosinicella sp.]